MIEIVASYGPYAFGVVVLLLLWKVVVEPERRRGDAQLSIQQRSVELLTTFTTEQREISQAERKAFAEFVAAQTTALGGIVDTLDCVAAKIRDERRRSNESSGETGHRGGG